MNKNRLLLCIALAVSGTTNADTLICGESPKIEVECESDQYAFCVVRGFIKTRCTTRRSGDDGSLDATLSVMLGQDVKLTDEDKATLLREGSLVIEGGSIHINAPSAPPAPPPPTPPGAPGGLNENPAPSVPQPVYLQTCFLETDAGMLTIAAESNEAAVQQFCSSSGLANCSALVRSVNCSPSHDNSPVKPRQDVVVPAPDSHYVAPDKEPTPAAPLKTCLVGSSNGVVTLTATSESEALQKACPGDLPDCRSSVSISCSPP